jgi:pimeloyl-ACP methyl ester carboxylesterase
LPEPKAKRRWLRSTLLAILALLIVLGAAVYLHPIWCAENFTRAWLRLQGARGGYVQLDPYRLHYVVAGAGKPLVLVHGLAGQANDWARWIPVLAKHRYRVYAVDLLGFGRSDRPNVDYSIALQTDVLRQFFDSQHIKQADLGGWSMGGWIALKFTVDHPERVRRLFVCDSAGVYFQPAFPPELFSPTTPQQVDQLMALVASHPPPIPGFVARDLIRRAVRERSIVQSALASMEAGTDVLDGKLEKIGQPTLILWGKQDATTPLAVGEEIHREMPQSLLAVFDGCGHLAPEECSGPLIAEAARFLQADPPLAGGTHEFGPPQN